MAKATLAKSFEHDGRSYRMGDEFEGSEAEIADLIRQGYIKHKEEAEDPALHTPPTTGASKSKY